MIDKLETIFSFIGGLGLFLYGMNVMADGLQKSTGNRMKNLLSYLTKNRLMAIIFGALVTAIIQSSSATTVMVVGFVNAGIMDLVQAVGVIMGANVGTTITAWIVSMNEWSKMLNPDFFAPLVIGIGAFFMVFSKREKQKEVGEILVGFGVLFIGLGFMSDSIRPYADSPVFAKAFTTLGSNPILGIVTGAVVTALIQSSSASVGILQTLAANGIVTWNSAVYITLGQNIGTCVTALLSSAGANKTAKRAAVIHLLFNLIGAITFGIIMFIVFRFEPSFASSDINSVKISIFHTIFNVTNTVLLFPFAKQLVDISGRLVRDKSADSNDNGVINKLHLDNRLFDTPSFAVENAIKEVIHMGETTLKNSKRSVECLFSRDMSLIKEVFQEEKVIDEQSRLITEYLIKVSNLSLTAKQQIIVNHLFNTVSNMERVGDHAENLAELAEHKINTNIEFSHEAVEELKEISKVALKSFESAVKARVTEDMNWVDKVVKYEEQVDQLEERFREQHIKRLAKNLCDPEIGIIYVDILVNLERMSDHSLNVAGLVKQEIEY